MCDILYMHSASVDVHDLLSASLIPYQSACTLLLTVLAESLIRTHLHRNAFPYIQRGEFEDWDACCLIQSNPFGDGPGLTILIGLWLPDDKESAESEGRRWTTVDKKQSQSPLTVISSSRRCFSFTRRHWLSPWKTFYEKKIPTLWWQFLYDLKITSYNRFSYWTTWQLNRHPTNKSSKQDKCKHMHSHICTPIVTLNHNYLCNRTHNKKKAYFEMSSFFYCIFQ